MRYLSICSGIEAATVAWEPLGFEALGFSEIDRFPSAVLKHHYPHVHNFGDFTTIQAADNGTIDILVGGTPCQSFSIAGLRRGMADKRGNLALEFLRLAARTRPRWVVWENVPGVLSSNGGRDFGAFLGGMVECGYGFAYRVLDAQYFGLAQRRKRVFVVGYLGDWRRAAAVLFERESLSWNPPPRSKARESLAGTLGARTCNSVGVQDAQSGDLIAPSLTSNPYGDHESREGLLVAHSLNAKGGSGRIDAESETFVTHSLRAEGFDASEDGTGRGVPLVPVAYRTTGNDGVYELGDLAGCLNTGTDPSAQVITFALGSHDGAADGDQTNRCHANGGPVGSGISEEVSYSLRAGRTQNIANVSAVRRLTPRECERLQGFPDDYTAIPYRGKQAADGPRYKALGNSMAVSVMAWIGRGIASIDRL